MHPWKCLLMPQARMDGGLTGQDDGLQTTGL